MTPQRRALVIALLVGLVAGFASAVFFGAGTTSTPWWDWIRVGGNDYTLFTYSAGAALAGFLLWAAPTSVTLADWSNAPLIAKFAAGAGFAVACATSCLCSLAICLRFAHWRAWAFDSLSTNAYRMYLIHYVFAVWLQYALLGTDLFAIGKAVIVFGGTLIMSWSIAAAMAGALPVLRLSETIRGVRGA